MITYINSRYDIDLRQIQFGWSAILFKPSKASSSIWPVKVPDQVKDTGCAPGHRYAKSVGDIKSIKVNW